MIHEVTGDILLSKAHWIAHGVAPHDDFKNGLARTLREQFPGLYKDFRHWCKTKSPKPGAAWLWSGVRAGGRVIHVVSLLTQDAPDREGAHPGRARASHVNHALHELAKLVAQHHCESLALPRLACGVGGLEWRDVRPLIAATLGPLGISVHVYATFQRGVAADEAPTTVGRERR